MSTANYTRCALNGTKDPSAKTCVPSGEILDYYEKEGEPTDVSKPELEKRLIHDICNGTACSDETFVNHLSSSANSRLRYIAEIAYKPLWPAGRGKETNWPLTNLEIDHIQQQFKYRQPDYLPLKTWYVDFMDTFPEPNIYREFDYLKHANETDSRYVGFIYNTDRYPNGGVHWISVLIDVIEGKFEVFDSFGRDPAPEILAYLEFVDAKLRPKFGNGLELVVSRKLHQSTSSDECGIYALNFIWRRLSGATMEEINSKRISSDFMREFRHILFRKPY